MQTSLYILITFFTLATALRGSNDKAQASVEEEFVRRGLAATCPYKKKGQVYFEVSTSVIPSADSCTVEERERFAIRINAALEDIGIESEDTTTVAQVCVKPTGSKRFLQSFQRILTGGWTYNGGGGCSFCGSDDDDHRRVLTTTGSEKDEQKFEGVVAPSLEIKLEDVLNEDVNQWIPCAGSKTKVEVSITLSHATRLEDMLSCSPLDVATIDQEVTELDEQKEAIANP